MHARAAPYHQRGYVRLKARLSQAEYPQTVRVERMDAASIPEVEALAAELDDVPIDVLINNAGVYSDRSECCEAACTGAYVTERPERNRGLAGTVETAPSVTGMIKVIDEAKMEDTGKFLQYDGTTAPW